MALPLSVRVTKDRSRAAETALYGRSVWCLDSLQTGRYATGLRVVAQDVYHRLITRPGELRDAPDFGLGLEDRIGSVASETDAKALEQEIVNELVEDERLERVEASVGFGTTDGVGVSYEIRIECVAEQGGSFDLVLGVEGVSVELLGIDFAEAA